MAEIDALDSTDNEKPQTFIPATMVRLGVTESDVDVVLLQDAQHFIEAVVGGRLRSQQLRTLTKL